jgi:hypothetical protein
MKYMLSEIPYIQEAHLELFEKNGIRSTDDLLDRAGMPTKRKVFLEVTGIEEDLLIHWLTIADISRIKGVDIKLAFLMMQANVDSVQTLSNTNASQLRNRILPINKVAKIKRHNPSIKVLKEIIDRSAELKSKVSFQATIPDSKEDIQKMSQFQSKAIVNIKYKWVMMFLVGISLLMILSFANGALAVLNYYSIEIWQNVRNFVLYAALSLTASLILTGSFSLLFYFSLNRFLNERIFHSFIKRRIFRRYIIYYMNHKKITALVKMIKVGQSILIASVLVSLLFIPNLSIMITITEIGALLFICLIGSTDIITVLHIKNNESDSGFYPFYIQRVLYYKFTNWLLILVWIIFTLYLGQGILNVHQFLLKKIIYTPVENLINYKLIDISSTLIIGDELAFTITNAIVLVITITFIIYFLIPFFLYGKPARALIYIAFAVIAYFIDNWIIPNVKSSLLLPKGSISAVIITAILVFSNTVFFDWTYDISDSTEVNCLECGETIPEAKLICPNCGCDN